MKLLTTDDRSLSLISLGQMERYKTEEGKYDYRANSSENIVCEDENGKRVVIKISDVKRWEGVYFFPPLNVRSHD